MELSETAQLRRQASSHIREAGVNNLLFEVSAPVEILEPKDVPAKEISIKPSKEALEEEANVNKSDATVIKDFFNAEGLGVEAPRRCTRCRGCKDCKLSGVIQTDNKSMEYEWLKRGVHLNRATNKIEVQYAFLEDPAKLGNNIKQVIGIAISEEIKLDREGLTGAFNLKLKG